MDRAFPPRPWSRLGLLALALGVACGWKVNPGPAPLVTAQQVPVLVSPASHETPELVVELRAGSAYDPVGREGLAFQTALASRYAGSATRTPDQVSEALRSWGATLKVDVGRERVAFRLSVPAEHLVEAAGLLADLVAAPVLDVATVNRAKFDGLELSPATSMAPPELAALLCRRLTYDGHPYGHPTVGRPATANLVSELDVAQFREQRYLRSVVAAGVGGLPEGSPEAAAAAEALRVGLERLPPRLSRDVTPRLPPTPEARSVVLVSQQKWSQDAASLGQSLDLRWSDPDGAALLVAVHALDRRLTDAVRAQARWVDAFTTVQGELRIDLALGPEDTAALPKTLRVLELFAQDGVEPWELDGARADVLAGLKAPAEARDWALSAQLLGVPDPAVALPPRLEALTPASVNAAIARWIHPERLSIAVVAREPEVYRAAFIEETGASGVQAGGYALGVKTLTVVSDEELNP